MTRTSSPVPGTTTVPVREHKALRTVLGRFTTGVAVVTTATPDGPRGMTVNSFSSVSLDPPLVLFAVSRASSQYPAFAGPEPFAVHVLSESQRAVSRRFASPGLDRFGHLTFVRDENGVPLLAGALAVLRCHTDRVVPAGDHDIVIGRVVEACVPLDQEAAPLVYYGGSYRSLSDDHADWSALLL